jgi:hypothetical protein
VVALEKSYGGLQPLGRGNGKIGNPPAGTDQLGETVDVIFEAKPFSQRVKGALNLGMQQFTKLEH